MAAYYPTAPTQEDKENVTMLLESFMEVGVDYNEWGKKFLERMRKDNELDISGREEFAVWMCKQHNIFNQERGKKAYDCTYENLKKRWGPM